MSTIFKLNWLRESASNHLEADLGTTVASDQLEMAVLGLLPEQQAGKPWGVPKWVDLPRPQKLPTWAQRKLHHFFEEGRPTPEKLILVEGFCNRIRDRAWNMNEAALFLPYFGRRDWSDRFHSLPGIEFERTSNEITAAGVSPHSLREIALRAAAGAFTQSIPHSPVHFRCTTPVIEPWRNTLLDRYGFDVPAGSPPLAQFSMNAPGSVLAVWQDTPRERNSRFYSVFSRVALGVQYALRRWILAAFAVGPEELAQFDIGGDVIVYAATRPHAEKRNRDFSYDVLDADLMDYAFSRAARRIEPLMLLASRSLIEAGREDDARQYLRRDLHLHAPRLADRARRRNRVRAMLVAESVLIYALIRFSSRLKSIDSPRSITSAVDELVCDFDERIRKLFFFLPEAGEFCTMLFLEASNAIQCANGGQQALQLSAATTDGVEYQAVRPMSESYSPI